MRQGPVPASGGTGSGRRELALSPSLAGVLRATGAPVATGRDVGLRSSHGAARAPGSRPDAQKPGPPAGRRGRAPALDPAVRRALPKRLPTASSKRPPGHRRLRPVRPRSTASSLQVGAAEVTGAGRAGAAARGGGAGCSTRGGEPQAAAAPEAATRRWRVREPRLGGARAGTRAGRGSRPRRRSSEHPGARGARVAASELSPTAPTRAPSPDGRHRVAPRSSRAAKASRSSRRSCGSSARDLPRERSRRRRQSRPQVRAPTRRRGRPRRSRDAALRRTGPTRRRTVATPARRSATSTPVRRRGKAARTACSRRPPEPIAPSNLPSSSAG